MGNLPNLKPREIERILLRAGFGFDTKRGSHRTYYNPETDCHATIAFHPGTIPQGTLRGIIKQTGMGVEEFLLLRRKRKR